MQPGSDVATPAAAVLACVETSGTVKEEVRGSDVGFPTRGRPCVEPAWTTGSGHLGSDVGEATSASPCVNPEKDIARHEGDRREQA